MRTVSLANLEEGITRLRTKGGADPNSLYDLINGDVDAAGRPVSRHGTAADATLPTGTKGLMQYEDAFVVFSHEVVGGMPAGYTCLVLAHPTNSALTLSVVHFAAPFMGSPYVVGEFSNGDVYHYWLQDVPEWAAETAYRDGDVIVPTVSNGMAYRAKRLTAPYPAWAGSTERAVGDKVEPTVANGYYYEVIESDGRSGETEPAWPTEEGATVVEEIDLTPAVTETPESTSTGITTTTEDRYAIERSSDTIVQSEQ